MNDLIAQ